MQVERYNVIIETVWAGSVSAFDIVTNTCIGCALQNGAEHADLQGLPESLLAPGEAMPPWSLGLTRAVVYGGGAPTFGALESSFSFSREATAESACFLRTGASGALFSKTFNRMDRERIRRP
jgi:hypothetical protein